LGEVSDEFLLLKLLLMNLEKGFVTLSKLLPDLFLSCNADTCVGEGLDLV
jgi:hypothetical protein